jgi:hypothetical protein
MITKTDRRCSVSARRAARARSVLTSVRSTPPCLSVILQGGAADVPFPRSGGVSKTGVVTPLVGATARVLLRALQMVATVVCGGWVSASSHPPQARSLVFVCARRVPADADGRAPWRSFVGLKRHGARFDFHHHQCKSGVI